MNSTLSFRPFVRRLHVCLFLHSCRPHHLVRGSILFVLHRRLLEFHVHRPSSTPVVQDFPLLPAHLHPVRSTDPNRTVPDATGRWSKRDPWLSHPKVGDGEETPSNVRIRSMDQAGRARKIDHVPTLDPSEEPELSAIPLVRFESTNDRSPQLSRGMTNRNARPHSTARPSYSLLCATHTGFPF